MAARCFAPAETHELRASSCPCPLVVTNFLLRGGGAAWVVCAHAGAHIATVTATGGLPSAATMKWANTYLEREGLARLTISILIITTAGCLAYTWGYAEGVHNTQTIIGHHASTATPLLLHAGPQPQQHLAGTVGAPVAAADAGSTLLDGGTHHVHRRRARRSAPEDPAVATGGLPQAQGSDVVAVGGAGAAAGSTVPLFRDEDELRRLGIVTEVGSGR